MHARRFDPIGFAGGLLIPIGAAVLILVLTRVWEPRLPAEVAQHWDAAGSPDRFGALWPGAWMMAGITALTGAACGGIAAMGRSLLALRQIMLIVAITVTALLTGIWISSLAVQLDLADPAAAALPLWPAGLYTLAGLAVGVLFARQLRDGRVRVQAKRRPPSHLPRQAVSRIHESLTASAKLQALIVVPLVGLGLVLSVVSETLWALFVFIPLALLILLLLRSQVDVDGSGMRARMAGLTAFDIRTEEIVKAEVKQVSPAAEFGGYGLRIRGKGQYGLVFRRGPAVVVTTASDQTFTVTASQATEMAGVLNSAADSGREY
ncbi:DUF1648 domain-containing protein [Hoyosella subflava]|nr:DUF1648 domain-containing protein [Hoyosella subflava]